MRASCAGEGVSWPFFSTKRVPPNPNLEGSGGIEYDIHDLEGKEQRHVSGVEVRRDQHVRAV